MLQATLHTCTTTRSTPACTTLCARIPCCLLLQTPAQAFDPVELRASCPDCCLPQHGQAALSCCPLPYTTAVLILSSGFSTADSCSPAGLSALAGPRQLACCDQRLARQRAPAQQLCSAERLCASEWLWAQQRTTPARLQPGKLCCCTVNILRVSCAQCLAQPVTMPLSDAQHCVGTPQPLLSDRRPDVPCSTCLLHTA